MTAFALVQMREAQLQRDRSWYRPSAEKQAEFVTLMMSTGEMLDIAERALLDAGLKLLHEHYTDDPVFRATALLNLSARYAGISGSAARNTRSWPRPTPSPSGSTTRRSSPARSAVFQKRKSYWATWIRPSRIWPRDAALACVVNPDPLFVEDCTEDQATWLDAQGKPQAAIHAEKALGLLKAPARRGIYATPIC